MDNQDLLREHIRTEEEQILCIMDSIKVIKENHLAHIEKSVAEHTEAIDWIKKIVIGTFMATVATFISTLIKR